MIKVSLPEKNKKEDDQ